jgi:hypothetical protein
MPLHRPGQMSRGVACASENFMCVVRRMRIYPINGPRAGDKRKTVQCGGAQLANSTAAQSLLLSRCGHLFGLGIHCAPVTKQVALPPRASALIEAMRDIGYSFESAIADIIDNSISANAKSVEIRFGWDADHPWIAIVDNGIGMPPATLQNAMRPGSQNPLDTRAVSDLGRFGLGLKTASFSQCRELTCVSWQRGQRCAMRWDLDLVAKSEDWTLLELDDAEISALPGIGPPTDSGTAVLWRKIDRLELVGQGPAAHSNLNELMGIVRSHVARTFHRFIAGEPGQPKISMKINSLPVEPFDPFLAGNLATQHLPEESVILNGCEVLIQPYILPHHTKVTPSEYERLAGSEGYLRNQGFYVYRNRRLIIWGTWFRLARQEELTKLARIRIDVPNTLDQLWGFDVRKSRAHPPTLVRQRLKQVVERIRGSAKRPYTHRGAITVQRSVSAVWERKTFNDRIEYAINCTHPVIEDLLNDMDQSVRGRLRAVLSMVAISFPHATFFSDYATDPKSVEAVEGDVALLTKLAQIIAAGNPGIDRAALESMIASIEPFASWPHHLHKVVDSCFLTDKDIR